MADDKKKTTMVKWMKVENSLTKIAKRVLDGAQIHFGLDGIHSSWKDFLAMYGVTQFISDQYAGEADEAEKWNTVIDLKSAISEDKALYDSRPRAKGVKMDMTLLTAEEQELIKKLMLKARGK